MENCLRQNTTFEKSSIPNLITKGVKIEKHNCFFYTYDDAVQHYNTSRTAQGQETEVQRATEDALRDVEQDVSKIT